MTIQEIIDEIKKIQSPEELKKIWSEVAKHYRELKKDYFEVVQKKCAIAGARAKWAKYYVKNPKKK
jgi:hypothetical protein